MPHESRSESAWRWICRVAGLGAFIYVLIRHGIDAPWGFYVICGGLMGFGDIVANSIQINKNGKS